MAQHQLYVYGTIVTIDPDSVLIIDGAILVTGSRIGAIGQIRELLKHIDPASTKIIDLKEKVVIPGLINTHAHTAQSLLRGLAEELDLHDWLCSAIWPLEASFEGDDGYVAARLTMAEMLKSGTTTFLEAMLTHRAGWENIVRAVEESGMRACLGKLVKPKETNDSMTDARDRDVDEMSLDAAIQSHESYHGILDNRLHVWMALATPRGNDPSFHKEAAEAAHARGMRITMHCAETPRDLEIYQQYYDCSPMEFCKRNKIAGPKTVLAHMVNLDPAKDLQLLKETGTSVAHNASSNCELGSAGNLPARSALEMATINAARALGIDEEIGSLEAGKKADFVVVDPYSIGAAAEPWDAGQYLEGGIDPITVLVHSCTGRDVTMVVADGQVLVENGMLARINEKDLMAQARDRIRDTRVRSGVHSTLSKFQSIT